MTKTNSTNNRIKNIYTLFMAVILMVSALVMTNINASAAATVPDQYACIFNAEYYAAKYPDLAAAFGSNEAALFNHFLTAGMAEGRQGSAEFDVNFYRVAYPDLAAAFGDNLPAYYNHYMSAGKAEGRVGAGVANVASTGQAAIQGSTAATGSNGARLTQGTDQYGRIQIGFESFREQGEADFYLNILRNIGINDSMSDMEVARAIHDYLCRTYHCAQDGEIVVTLNYLCSYTLHPHRDPSMQQRILNSTAFDCSGYAQAYRTLMNLAGIQTESVCGRAENGVGHVWNRTMINGQWLYTDVGWDDSLSTTRYFMISESQMNQDHLPERNGQYRCY